MGMSLIFVLLSPLPRTVEKEREQSVRTIRTEKCWDPNERFYTIDVLRFGKEQSRSNPGQGILQLSPATSLHCTHSQEFMLPPSHPFTFLHQPNKQITQPMANVSGILYFLGYVPWKTLTLIIF